MSAGVGVTPTTHKTTPARPPRSTVNVEVIRSLPLTGRPQWAAFRYGLRDGAWTKIPKQPNGKNARTNDSSTWSTFEAALAAFEADPTLDGIGYIFAEDDPYCGVDIDKVRNAPERLAWALGIIQRLGTFAEWSVSGNGLHAVGEGRMPDTDGAPQKGRNDQAKGLEAYSRRRFFTFTGKLIEGTSTAVANVQEQLDWLLANEFKPKDTGRPTVSISRIASAIATTDRIERIKERMFSGPRGDQLRRLYDGDAGDYLKADGSSDWSSADLSLCSGAWYYADGDEATVEAIWLASGLASGRPNGGKLDRADYRRSTLATARGSKTFRDTHGYSAWEDPPRIQFKPKPPERAPIGGDDAGTCSSDQPANLEEALALIAGLRQENAELSQSNVDLLGWVDRTAGFVEELQTINAGLRRDLDQIAEFRAEDRRLTTADRALGQVKAYTTNQKAAIKSFAIVAASKASRGEAEAVITRGEIADAMGAHEATAGAALKSVFELDGVPIPRWNEYVDGEDGEGRFLRKKITKYAVKDWTSPAAIIEAFVDVGTAQTERVKRYSEPRRCPDHPDAAAVTRTVCEECGFPLSEPRTRSAPIGATHSHRESPTAPVDEPVTYNERLARIGHDGAEKAERPSNVLPFTHHTSSEVLPGQDGERRDYDITGRCPECMEHTVTRRRSGVWTCALCSAIIHVEPWAQEDSSRPQQRPDTCPAPDCTALEFRQLPDGSWRCLKSAHDPRAYGLAAVAGGSDE